MHSCIFCLLLIFFFFIVFSFVSCSGFFVANKDLYAITKLARFSVRNQCHVPASVTRYSASISRTYIQTSVPTRPAAGHLQRTTQLPAPSSARRSTTRKCRQRRRRRRRPRRLKIRVEAARRGAARGTTGVRGGRTDGLRPVGRCWW